MKSTTSLFLSVGCTLLLAGCSSTSPTKVDTGTITARTFNFVQPEKPLPEFAERKRQIHELVQAAITQSLARRQVTRVDQGGDVTVAYLIVVGDNATTTEINDYFGYGRDTEKLWDKAHSEYTNGKNPNYFVAGTLLIDIIDSKTWKVLKRGYTTRVLLNNPTPEERAARVDAAVEEILGNVRFKP